MHANPLTAVHEENLMQDEDSGQVVIGPGKTIRPKAGKRLEDCLEFAQLPDADTRSMELFQTGMQLAQLRSGITNASQGDLSSVPESNTATGVKALMSRAAVLLKKPVRRLRRAKGRGFSYAVKLLYANFDREEAFAWGEGADKELITITPEHVRDLDIDVVMLLTQEQNQEKLQAAQVMMTLEQSYSGLPETDKAGARIGIVQALKALEFANPEEMARRPVVTIESCLPLLPPDEATKLKGLLALQQQQQQASAAAPAAGAAPGQPAGAAPGQPVPHPPSAISSSAAARSHQRSCLPSQRLLKRALHRRVRGRRHPAPRHVLPVPHLRHRQHLPPGEDSHPRRNLAPLHRSRRERALPRKEAAPWHATGLKDKSCWIPKRPLPRRPRRRSHPSRGTWNPSNWPLI